MSENEANSQSEGHASEWRLGWPLVLGGTMAAGIGAFHTQSLGAAMTVLTEQFGWTRTQISTGPFIISMTSLVVAPLVGALVVRFGPRRVGLISPWLFALALMLIGQTGPNIWTWYLAFGFIALISPAVTPLVWSTAIISRFEAHRGMALGVVIAGVAMIGGFVPFFMTWAIEAHGWRTAYAMLGAVALLVSFPALYFLFFDANDMRARGRADKLPTFANREAAARRPSGVTTQAAITSGRFWRLVVIMVIAGSVSGFFMVHLLPMLTDAGVSRQTAGMIMGSVAPSIVIARLLTGWLLDRIFAPYIVAGVLLMPILACLLLANFPPSAALGWAVAILIGFALGTEADAIPYLVSRYFGLRNYAVIYGFVMASFTLGYGGGPLVGAIVFDQTGSYGSVMAFAVAALGAAILLLFTLGRYPAHRVEKEALDPQPQPV